MKANPIDKIKIPLAEFSKLVGDVESTTGRLEDAQAELQQLTESGDLLDEKVLNTISRLRLFVELFPGRLAIREEAIAEIKGKLLDALAEFTGNDMQVRFNDLKAKARALVEPRLKPMFSNENDLTNAINNSPEMKRVLDFWTKLDTARGSGLLHAEHERTVKLGNSILALWKLGEEIEIQLQAKQ